VIALLFEPQADLAKRLLMAGTVNPLARFEADVWRAVLPLLDGG
jgi:hypothetical protein